MILMLGLVLGLTNFVLAFLCSLPVLCLPFFGKHTASTKKASTFHTCPFLMDEVIVCKNTHVRGAAR